jgi:cyclic beta-1,2-glucan synthetase
MEFSEQNRPYSHFLSILRRSTDLLNEDPIRDEIFSIERLEIYAAHLGGELTVSSDPKRGRSILPELKENGRALLNAYLQLTEAIRNKQTVSPAAEWFVDNFHIVEEQIREIKQDLPKSYYDELPKLAEGELKGYPRVYAIALAIIAHTDSRLDGEMVRRFIRAFQQRSPLTIGELWATAITLRIALVEHLKPLALRVVSAREKRSEADSLADLLLGLAAQTDAKPQALLELLKSKVGKPENFDRAFIVQLIQRLRDQDLDVLPAFEWLEKQLGDYHHTNTHDVTQLEHNRQATAQVTVGNIISSMRLLSALNWQEFVESVSLVDPILSRDPAGVYAKMDFATRDRYRHAVERLSKRSDFSEIEIVEEVVCVAKDASEDLKRSHVGYYLIGDGRFGFQKRVHYRPRLREFITTCVLSHPTWVYLGTLAALTLALLLPVLKYFWDTGGHGYSAFCFCLLASRRANLHFAFLITTSPFFSNRDRYQS